MTTNATRDLVVKMCIDQPGLEATLHNMYGHICDRIEYTTGKTVYEVYHERETARGVFLQAIADGHSPAEAQRDALNAIGYKE